jgi:hypothetical protein
VGPSHHYQKRVPPDKFVVHQIILVEALVPVQTAALSGVCVRMESELEHVLVEVFAVCQQEVAEHNRQQVQRVQVFGGRVYVFL